MFSIMLTSEVCWCVFSITIVYLSLYFLASNPLIILTEPSAAKIQNQHTEKSSELQASSPVPSSPPWPFSWVESGPGSNALSGSGSPSLCPGERRARIDGSSELALRSQIVPRPCSASFIYCLNSLLITTTSTFARDRT